MSVATAIAPGDAMIPESAPFSPEQRAWLNGFFAGLLSLDRKAGAAALDGPMPDDAAMPIAERMALAEARPLSRRLFAAMAQQDCGQCGYLCETYSAAIASGLEKKLNLCVPGGKETSRTLKRLLEEAPAAGKASPSQGPMQPQAQTEAQTETQTGTQPHGHT